MWTAEIIYIGPKRRATNKVVIRLQFFFSIKNPRVIVAQYLESADPWRRDKFRSPRHIVVAVTRHLM